MQTRTAPSRRAGPVRGSRARAGFTLVEVLFALLIIFLLMGLLLVGFRAATRASRASADRQSVSALKIAVDRFKQEFGHLPALVKDDAMDGGPLDVTGKRPVVYSPGVAADLMFLRDDPPTPPTDRDTRYSVYTLPYYVLGVLGEAYDGVDGAGFLEPKRDGSFTKRQTGTGRTGRVFEPFFDSSRNSRGVFTEDVETGRIELRDRNGTPYRYYRWVRDAGSPVAGDPLNDYLNVPEILGDPAMDEFRHLRDAEYAVVGAGPNGLIGDEHLPPVVIMTLADMRTELGLSSGVADAEVLRIAREDNIVEVGR